MDNPKMFDGPVILLHFCTIAKFRNTKNSLLKYVWFNEEIIHTGYV